MFRSFASRPYRRSGRKCLTFDLAYSVSSLTKHGQERHILQRDLGGFFEHVYTVYPLLGVDPQDREEKFDGLQRAISLSESHTFIEHKAFAFRPENALALVASQGALLLWCCKLVIQKKIDVVRATDPFLTGSLAYAVARLTGRPFCMRLGTNYDALAERGTYPFPRLFADYEQARKVSRFILPRCDLLLPANEDYKRYAIQNGARPEHCVTVPYGSVIAKEHFTPPEERLPAPEELPSGVPLAIVVGRLIEVKKPFDILSVAELICHDLPETVIVMVGEGELQEGLARRSRERGLERNVLFVGSKDQSWLVRAYPRFTAYLSPLTGRALAEAALAGIPAIAYDCDWHSELVISGETGFLVPPGDTKAMAEAFVKLAKDPTMGRQLGVNARKRSLEMMDPVMLLHREQAAFNRLLETGTETW